MDIEVKGHSGCSIDIVREGKELFILKGTCDPQVCGATLSAGFEATEGW